MKLLLKFIVGKEFFAAAPVVEYACGTSGVVFKGVSKLADDISRRRECSFTVDRGSYINISDSKQNKYFITYQALISSRAHKLPSGGRLVVAVYSSVPLHRSP